jgi:hypothetical protein
MHFRDNGVHPFTPPRSGGSRPPLPILSTLDSAPKQSATTVDGSKAVGLNTVRRAWRGAEDLTGPSGFRPAALSHRTDANGARLAAINRVWGERALLVRWVGECASRSSAEHLQLL